MKCFFASVALRLFHFNGLRRGLHFDAIEVQVKGVDLFDTVRSFHKYWFADRLDVDRHLKVVFLLTDERVVSITKIKTFVGVDPIIGRRSGCEQKKH